MILSVGPLALGTLLFRAARQATATSALTYQTAALTGEAGRLGPCPSLSWPAGTTCVNVTHGAVPAHAV